MDEPTKLVIDVTGGIFPGEVIDRYTRRWTLTKSETQDREKYMDALGASVLYAISISEPSQNNWVRWEWTWL